MDDKQIESKLLALNECIALHNHLLKEFKKVGIHPDGKASQRE